MARKSLQQLGSLQRSIMDVVWHRGEATVQQVLDTVGRPRRLAYTTVLSAMQKLEKAGWLAHRQDGRAYVYRAARSRTEENIWAIRQLIDGVFGNDPLLFFEHLLEDEQLTVDDLTLLGSMIDRRRREIHDD